MYVRERKQLLELLTTVHQTLEFARTHMNCALGYIEQSIEGIQAIYNFLKDRHPDYDLRFINQVLVDLEIIYKNIENPKSARSLSKIKKNISAIKGDILKNIKVKWIAVFLPYKASMWTSLESIWIAAKEDNNCESYVIPIPYYERDENGDLKNRIYEGHLFPDYVPITYYKTIDLEIVKPDFIFIHNPYDNYNKLTMVEPCYFSSNLKMHTSLLVYSPYFTFSQYNPSAPSLQFDNIGTHNADIVLTQSELVKQLYIKHGCDPKKLLAIGSPKMDAVIKNLKSPVQIPVSWKEKAINKSVFLLNTHLYYIPKLGKKAIDIINQVITKITDQNDCVLIWRPHPLSNMVIKNQFPQYSEQYSALMDKFLSKANTILDNEASYFPAFNLSDALFSTYSSLNNEYILSGKPIMIMQKKSSENIRKSSPVDYSYNYFLQESSSALNDFVKMVKERRDPLNKERLNMIRSSFLNSDGTCGEKVYNFIIKKSGFIK